LLRRWPTAKQVARRKSVMILGSRARTLGVCTACAAIAGALGNAQTPERPTAPGRVERCRITGRATSGNVPLPGVSISVQAADALKAATSTDSDGRFLIVFAPGVTLHLAADLTGFLRVEREITLSAPPCDTTVDFTLSLRPRAEPAPAGATGAPRIEPRAGAVTGRGGQTRQGLPRFQALNVEPNASGAAPESVATPEESAADVARLLPPGFSMQNAQADAIAIAGRGDAARLDRGLMGDRSQAIRLGEIDPTTGQFTGFGPQGAAGGLGPGGDGGFGGPLGGRGGVGGRGGGRGGFILGGRGARGQSPYQGSTTYSFGGSALDAPPYQLRPEVPVTQPRFAQNNFGGTFGGPLKIPGLYANANRRTNFQINYTGSEANNVFDQYATVPTDAMRAGDFSSSPIQLVDKTGAPLAGNRVPIDPVAASLLAFIPQPNLPGTSQNYHVSTTAHTASQAVSLRLTQNLSPTVTPGRGGAAGGRVGFGGGAFGGGRVGGPGGGRGTNINLTAQLQVRRTESQALNVFPDLGGDTINTSVSAPINLTVVKGRSIQNLNVNLTHARTETTNAFSDAQDVAGLAGIHYPSAPDPLNWGVPNLAFSGFTGVRGVAASERSDDRLTAGYAWIHPASQHRLRIGGDYRLDRSASDINSNARGTFTFNGRYSSGGERVPPLSGADFADFLMGEPAQSSLQVGGMSHLRQHSFDAYIEDNWQKNAKLTFNLGLRYELARPYVEVNGRMANLDATPDLSGVKPVASGGAGPYSGVFPAGLLDTDANNVGPRLGVAYRLPKNTILRGGYSITYNSGSYSSIARELVGQPPFADTETVTGSAEHPLTIAEALLSPVPESSNNWGVDRSYALGMIQTWNTSVTRNVTQNWMLQAGYTGIKGTDLDILRAPDLLGGGFLAPGTQPFIWESSGGHSIMNAGNVQIRRRLAGGIGGGASYTIAKSMDNASSLGAGAPMVAQNDKDLEAEWAPSTFDRRQQLSGDLYVELPWGPTRRWLRNGGVAAAIFGEWSAQLNVTVQSGTPLTVRVLGAASDIVRGVNGSLRANYNGGPIQPTDPTVDEFFNVNAFSAPLSGQFGDSARNMVVGPGARQLNALFQRDVRFHSNRTVTLQVNAVNLLNTVQWASIDTNVNSLNFGRVVSVRPMRTVTVSARFRF
jgi:trimeric autotransporter adhesin